VKSAWRIVTQRSSRKQKQDDAAPGSNPVPQVTPISIPGGHPTPQVTSWVSWLFPFLSPPNPNMAPTSVEPSPPVSDGDTPALSWTSWDSAPNVAPTSTSVQPTLPVPGGYPEPLDRSLPIPQTLTFAPGLNPRDQITSWATWQPDPNIAPSKGPPQPARPAWRTVPQRTSRNQKKNPPAHLPNLDLRPEVISWATWQPDNNLAPTPPPFEPFDIGGSPGLFGPRTPRGF